MARDSKRCGARLLPEDDAKKRTEICHRGEVALRELFLCAMTEADKRRLWRVQRVLHVLDDAQAETKVGVEEALKRHDSDNDTEALKRTLRSLIVPVSPDTEAKEA